jgi:hypothetical protein
MIWNPWMVIRKLEERLKHEMDCADKFMEFSVDFSNKLSRANDSLRNIAAEEKPNSSAVVKRMAAMAREGLKQ